MSNYLSYRAFVIDALTKFLNELKGYFALHESPTMDMPDTAATRYSTVWSEDVRQSYHESDFIITRLVSGYTVQTYQNEGDTLILSRASNTGSAFLTYAILKKNGANALYAVVSRGSNGNNVEKIAEIATNSDIDSCVSDSGILVSS